MSFRCHGKLIDRFASTLPVLMRFGLSTHDRVARCGISWTLRACSRNRISWQATNTRACDIFGYRFHFWCVFADRFRPSFTLIWYVCAFVLIHCQERFQIRINVDERPKRIEMCAFSNDNVLVWGHSVFKKPSTKCGNQLPGCFAQSSLPCNCTFLQNIVIKTSRH